MKLSMGMLLCASVVLGQNTPDAARSRYRQQGTEALRKEQDRSKASLCNESREEGDNARIAQCLAEHGTVTEQDYIAYVGAIDALLRLLDSESAQSPQKSLPFDSAELAWQAYRDRTCASMATQWEGSDQAPVAYNDCRLRLMWNHLNELADLYSDLWNSHATSRGQPPSSASEALAAVIAEVKGKSRVALLVPSELPQPVAKAKHAVIESASDNEYSISLYYELSVGDSGFAASFTANAHPDYGPKNLPNMDEVKLSGGLVGYFRPVSCGGSCAPANLRWEENRILYQIQLELSSTLSEDDQRRAIIAVANSAILAGPR
jgi:hypothetical protein